MLLKSIFQKLFEWVYLNVCVSECVSECVCVCDRPVEFHSVLFLGFLHGKMVQMRTAFGEL